jgi:hypothetical protein
MRAYRQTRYVLGIKGLRAYRGDHLGLTFKHTPAPGSLNPGVENDTPVGTLFGQADMCGECLSGMGKTQVQIVGLLGLLSLITFNNAFWVAALLLAAIPISQIVLPVKVKSLRSGRTGKRRIR